MTVADGRTFGLDIREPALCPHPDCERSNDSPQIACLVHWKALGRAGRVRVTNAEGRPSEQLHIAEQHWFSDAS